MRNRKLNALGHWFGLERPGEAKGGGSQVFVRMFPVGYKARFMWWMNAWFDVFLSSK